MRAIAIACLMASTLVATAQPSQAADLPVKASPLLPAYDWSGWYAGVNVGGVWGHSDVDPNVGVPFPVFFNPAVPGLGFVITPAQLGAFPPTSGNGSNVMGGVQIGRNWQTASRWIFGFEADIDGMGLREASSATVVRTTLSGTQTVTALYSANIDWTASLRGRIGYAWDRWMVYGTGGVATASTRLNTTHAIVQLNPVPTPGSASDREQVWGWTLGFGGEWAFKNDWSLGFEYRHTDYGSHGYNTGFVDVQLIGFVPPNATSVRWTTDEVTARLNYHFWK